MNGQPFSPERLRNIRRLRKARRLFKQTPLFAFHLMELEYPGYTQDEFLEDLRRRTKRKSKPKKTPQRRYGRYYRVQALKERYASTGDEEAIRMAMRLQSVMTKPYRFLVRLKNQAKEFNLSPLIPISRVEQLNQSFTACKTMVEVEQLIDAFIASERIQ